MTMICFKFEWSATIIILWTAWVKGVKITSDKSEYILLPNTTLNNDTLTCEGRWNPVQWYFEKNDGSLFPKKVSNSADYDDEKIGFRFMKYRRYRNNNFICVAKRYNMNVEQQFVHHNSQSFRINNGNSDYVISGQNVTINCSSTPFALNKWSVLNWTVPEKIENQTESVKIDPGQSFIVLKGKITMNMQNVTIKDEGNYICNVIEDVFEKTKFNISYELKVIAPIKTHINMKILNNTNLKICPAGYQIVSWKVHVSAYPNVTLEWKNPKGNTIQTIKEKIYVENDNQSSQLFIKNLELYDSGVYKLIAYNEVEKKEISVKLLVENPPIIVSISISNSSKLNCEFGNLCNFEFLVHGYPLPEVEWTYTSCKNNRSAECDTPIKVQKTPLSSVTLKYIVTLIAIETSTLICNASNKFGNSIKEYSLLDADDTLTESIHPNTINFIILTLILLLVIVIFGVLWFIRKWITKSKTERTMYSMNEFENHTVENWNPDLGVEEQAHILPYDYRWEFPIDKIKLGIQLGSGAFGVVYKAKATGIIDEDTTITVAIKTVRSNADACHKMALASELKIMTHIGRHLNIVNLLGACTTNVSKKLMVIVEYCCFGSIDRYMQKHKCDFINQVTLDGFIEYDVEKALRKHNYENVPFEASISVTCNEVNQQRIPDVHSVSNEVERKKFDDVHHGDHKQLHNSKPMCTNDLLCWSYQISKGMDYLASRKILHGDLAARNILLAEDNVVKICDFGLAKNLYKSEIYKKSKKALLPIKWLAIESMRERIFSTASDVWSFGIVLWEIFSLAADPYPNLSMDDLLDVLVQGYRMKPPIYSNSKIYDIMLDCWKEKPTDRPSFSKLLIRVGDLLQECTKVEYANLNENRMKIYNEKLPSSDILSLLAAPNRSNDSSTVPDTIHVTRSSRKNSEHSDDINDIEMKSMVVNNPNYLI